MDNYEKALKLVNRGFASKHSTFDKTGYVFIDLGGRWGGYISPKEDFVEVVLNNVHVGHGNIDLDRMMVLDASHRPDYDRHIEVEVVKSEG